MNARAAGRHFLQIPGPTHVPQRILLAIAEPTIDTLICALSGVEMG
jgi:alanine-glyoxylate transaminase / serine-glyoxylate transaminase / serine-pyruvate transaminase